MSSVEYEIVSPSPVMSTPVAKTTPEDDGGEEYLDEETPFRLPARMSKSSLKSECLYTPVTAVAHSFCLGIHPHPPDWFGGPL